MVKGAPASVKATSQRSVHISCGLTSSSYILEEDVYCNSAKCHHLTSVKPMPSLPRLLAVICLGVVFVMLSITALLGREQMLAIVFGPVDLTAIDFRTLTHSNRPNQYLVCPHDL